MHELSIAMELAEIAKASVPENLKGARIQAVNVRIGRFSSVVPESLRFCFEIVRQQDPPLAQAALHIEEVPVTARCRDCGFQWTVEEPAFSCGSCGSGAVEILSGRELDIVSIEVETPE